MWGFLEISVITSLSVLCMLLMGWDISFLYPDPYLSFQQSGHESISIFLSSNTSFMYSFPHSSVYSFIHRFIPISTNSIPMPCPVLPVWPAFRTRRDEHGLCTQVAYKLEGKVAKKTQHFSTLTQVL